MKTIYNKSDWSGEEAELRINKSKRVATMESGLKFRLVNKDTYKCKETGDVEFVQYNIEIDDGYGWEETDWNVLRLFDYEDYYTASTWNNGLTREDKNEFVAVAQLIHNVY